MTTPLDPADLAQADLAHVGGGMKFDDFRRSGNVIDRRGLPRRASLDAESPPADPLPPLIRRPGDLSSQAGLDDIGT